MESNIFTIETNTVYGRYLTASRNIKEGELILKEVPLIIGSQIEAFHICFKCNKRLRTRVQICKNCCVATICSHDCRGENHSDGECAALKSSGLKAIHLIGSPQVIMPLRCLMLRIYEKNKWNNFMAMESHLEKRRHTLIWQTHREYVEKPLKNFLSPQDLDDEIIQTICGILDVNAFEVRPPQCDGMSGPKDCLRGIYVRASLMAHDCIGNTLLAVDDDFTLTVHASKNIPAGETIFFNYSNCMKGTCERRLHLQLGKYFDCDCRRCSDPSELGTHISSINCNKCKNGLVVPTIPLSDVYKTSWICQNCATVYKGAFIKSTLEEINDKILNLDITNVAECEDILKKLETSLSPQHYLILDLKQNMIPTYEQNLFNDWAVRRKIELCVDVIKVLKVIEPGISRLQGLALYKLQSTQLNLASKLYQSNEIPSFKYLELLKEAELNLTTAVKYLLYEPKKSPEGRLTPHALNDLKILRNTLKQIKAVCESKLTQKNDKLYEITHSKIIK